MANEIFNRQGAANGQTKHGAVVVNTGGRGIGNPDNLENIGISMERGITPVQEIADITDDYDDEWLEVRFYTGDTEA